MWAALCLSESGANVGFLLSFAFASLRRRFRQRNDLIINEWIKEVKSKSSKYVLLLTGGKEDTLLRGLNRGSTSASASASASTSYRGAVKYAQEPFAEVYGLASSDRGRVIDYSESTVRSTM